MRPAPRRVTGPMIWMAVMAGLFAAVSAFSRGGEQLFLTFASQTWLLAFWISADRRSP